MTPEETPMQAKSAMRLLILSDLHREVWGEMPIGIDLSVSGPDVVLLAGDIDADASSIPWAERTFPSIPTLYVSGNHEGYCGRIDDVRRQITKACATSPTVEYLQRREVVIGGIRFLGCTLWTDFCLFGADRRDEAMAAARDAINDFRLVRITSQGGRTIQPEDTAAWHEDDAFWLRMCLATPFPGPTVVVTHMAPSPASVAPRFRDSLLSAAFASDLEDLVAHADVWIHGHVHDSCNYSIGKCRVVCNPRGYPQRNGAPENPRFDPNFVVTVPVNPTCSSMAIES